MQKGYSRKKWNAKNPLNIPSEEKLAAPDPAYEEYLSLLQQRNRYLRNLKRKDDHQISLERKEQGFSLYLNGANTRNRSTGVGSHPIKPTTAREKGTESSRLAQFRTEVESNRALHAKSAPEDKHQRNWLAGSVNIKTSRGIKVNLKAPDILTGNYDDDFESDMSYSYQDSADEDSYGSSDDSDQQQLHEKLSQALCDFSDDDDQHSYGVSQGKHDKKQSKKGVSRLSNQMAARSGADQVTLSFADVKKLRQSLEMNTSIRQSMAQLEVEDADSDNIECHSDIAEEDIEEELDFSPNSSPTKSPVKLNPAYKSNDLIVLEFDAFKKPGKKTDHMLVATRKVDKDAMGILQSPRAHHPKERSITPVTSCLKHTSRSAGSTPSDNDYRRREINLKPSTPLKSSRPLSAQHKADIDKLDTNVEARAVMAALHAENSQLEAEQHNRDTQSAPGRPQDSSTHSSSTSNWKERLRATPTQLPSDMMADPTKGADSSINTIVQKVLQLDSRGQRRLLRALADLEHGVSIPDKPLSSTATKSSIKGAKPVKNVKHKAGLDQGDGRNQTIDIQISMLSNWGDTTKIGLTEIQFFGLNRRRIPVGADDVSILGTRPSSGSPKDNPIVLFNCKFKTIKERNMWTSEYDANHPIEINVTLRQPQSYDEDEMFGLSKMRIWNYNKSLTELGIGVKHVRVCVDKTLVYDGDIDKGCGNQIFDYCKTITITKLTCMTPRNAKPVAGNVHSHKKKATYLSATPVMDNVDLLSDYSEDHSPRQSFDVNGTSSGKYGNQPLQPSPLRSETRIMNHSQDPSLDLPVVDSYKSPPAPQPEKLIQDTIQSQEKSSNLAQPKGSVGEPKKKKVPTATLR